jgi:hypothetical protein
MTILVLLLIVLLFLGGIILPSWYFETFGFFFGWMFSDMLWRSIAEAIGSLLSSLNKSD